MSVSIFNRPDFQHPPDGWYQIEAKGRHPNRQAGVIQLIDDEACEAIVDRFNVDADAGKLRHGHEMLIDHEHFKDRTTKRPSPTVGCNGCSTALTAITGKFVGL